MEASSIPLGTRISALELPRECYGLRVYNGRLYIDIFHRCTEQPKWEPLLAFIRETRAAIFA